MPRLNKRSKKPTANTSMKPAGSKPELIDPATYSLTNYDEADRVVGEFHDVVARAERISAQLPANACDAFFELVLHPAGEQGEGLDEALDVRVEAAVGLQQQPAGGSGVLPGELLGHLPDEQQLALVIGVQRLAHVNVRSA